MVVFDLEWTQPVGRDNMEEIIQIGAVRLEKPGGTIMDSFSVYIKPTIYKELSPVAKKLPDAELSILSDVFFPKAYRTFCEWCSGDTVFASWGGQDLNVLAKNAEHWHLPALSVTEAYDLQGALSRTLDIDRQLSLETVVEYCRIPAAFSYHNALYDAMYAALITAWITPAALPTPPESEKTRKRKWRFSEWEYPAQPKYKTGLFPTRKRLLNGRKARGVFCPICGERFWIFRWFPLSRGIYYSSFVCQEHGRFPARLTVTLRTDGQWQGRCTVPILTDTERELICQASENAPILCHNKKKHPWRLNKQM